MLLVTACAHQSATPCERFTGSYALDPGSCRDTRGLMPVGVTTNRFPDESILEPAVIGIHQDDCDSVSFVIRGRPGFAVQTKWEHGALVHTQTEWSNLPPPIAIGLHGTWGWSLRRKPGSEDLLYTFTYAERGLALLIPYNAHRETTCTLAWQR